VHDDAAIDAVNFPAGHGTHEPPIPKEPGAHCDCIGVPVELAVGAAVSAGGGALVTVTCLGAVVVTAMSSVSCSTLILVRSANSPESFVALSSPTNSVFTETGVMAVIAAIMAVAAAASATAILVSMATAASAWDRRRRVPARMLLMITFSTV
jgi:hypothetical protein